MQLLFQTVALRGQVIGLLRVHGIAGLRRQLLQRLQLRFADAGKVLVAGDDVERQLTEVGAVLVVEPVEHRHILEQLRLIALQLVRNGIHIGADLLEACLHAGDAVLRAGEELAQTLGLLAVALKALQLADQIDQHIAHGAGILRLDRLQRRVGELRDVLLRVRAEEQHMIWIGHVQLADERLDRLALAVGQLRVRQTGTLRLLLLPLRHGHHGRGRLLGQLLDALFRLGGKRPVRLLQVQGKYQVIHLAHGDRSFSIHTV